MKGLPQEDAFVGLRCTGKSLVPEPKDEDEEAREEWAVVDARRDTRFGSNPSTLQRR